MTIDRDGKCVASSFDTIDHALLIRTLERHRCERWVLLYMRRWLEAAVELTIATILGPTAIERILEHLGVPARAPPRSPALEPMPRAA